MPQREFWKDVFYFGLPLIILLRLTHLFVGKTAAEPSSYSWEYLAIDVGCVFVAAGAYRLVRARR